MGRNFWVGAALALVGCGGGSDLAGPSRNVDQLMTDEDGRVFVGEGAARARLLVLDGDRQRAAAGVPVQVSKVGDGHLVRVSRDDDGYEPELVYLPSGASRTVAMRAATGNVVAGARRLALPIYEQDFLAETDLPGVAALAREKGRPTVVFLPATLDGEEATAKFRVYTSVFPDSLVALKNEGLPRPADGQIATGRARVVSTSGASRGAVPVRDQAITSAAVARRTSVTVPPQVTNLRTSTKGNADERLIEWDVEDPEQRLLAWEVGVDTTGPARRVPVTSRSLTVGARRGRHYVCVRPVFEAGPNEAQPQCSWYDAPNGTPAPDVRVKVKAVDNATRVARKPFAVDVEVENVGSAPAPAFNVAVSVAREASLSTGLGELRTLEIAGLSPGQKLSQRTQVSAPRDGFLYVVAEVTGLPEGLESNAQDNIDRLPFVVAPMGANRAPQLALVGDAASGRMTALRGQAVTVRAQADDPEEGDLSANVHWRSSKDGALGVGARADLTLSPGVHRVRSSVKEMNPDAEESAAEVPVEILDPAAPANAPPLVDAGPDVTTVVGGTVRLLGRASDPDGQPLTTSWSLVEGPAGSAPKLEGAQALTPALVADQPGRYRMALVASDGTVEVRDEVTVTVLATDRNQPPTLAVVVPETASVGQKITLQITSQDGDGDALTVTHRLTRPDDSQAVITWDAGSDTYSFTADKPGNYIVTVVVSDGRGGSASAGGLVTVK